MSKHYVSKKKQAERFTVAYVDVHECTCGKRHMRWLHLFFFVAILVLIYWLLTRKSNN